MADHTVTKTEDHKMELCTYDSSESSLIEIKMRSEKAQSTSDSTHWGWLKFVSPYLAPGGKSGALILAVGVTAISIAFVPGWSGYLLSLAVVIAVSRAS